MGAGKSTVGKLLADLLECLFIDTDEMIVQREKRSIAEIFAVDGEFYFRNCETAMLKELPQHQTAVYATGGGLIVREDNRRCMESLGLIVYLNTSWPTLQQRLQQSVDRPLVNSARDWENVKVLFDQRQTFYENADISIATDELTPLQVANKIVVGLTL